MRDPNRIYDFCNKLAGLWAANAPDLRFGQLVVNVLGQMNAENLDPFFLEDDEALGYFKQYLSK